MTQIRIRVAGLYFNEVVTMDGSGPFTVREVMDRYKVAGGLGGFTSFVPLNYDLQLASGADNQASILTISCQHPNPVVYKTYAYDRDSKTYVQDFPAGNQTIGGKVRRGGLYRLQETPLDGGSTVVAWQYYVHADNGGGEHKSATRPGEGFAPFGSEAARILVAGDLLTWRMVAIRRAPVEPNISRTVEVIS